MPLSPGNARNRTQSLNPPLKQNIGPCLQYALRLFGYGAFFQNLVIHKQYQLHCMLIIQVPYKLQQILYTMKRTKHIEVDCHSIREAYDRRIITLPHVSTSVQLADVLTKSLTHQRHNFLVSKLMLVDSPVSI